MVVLLVLVLHGWLSSFLWITDKDHGDRLSSFHYDKALRRISYTSPYRQNSVFFEAQDCQGFTRRIILRTISADDVDIASHIGMDINHQVASDQEYVAINLPLHGQVAAEQDDRTVNR